MFEPIYGSATTTMKPEILKLMKKYNKKWREREASTLEAEIINAIQRLIDEGLIKDGFTSRQIADIINEDLPKEDRIGVTHIGRKINSLGFEQERIGEKRVRKWILDETVFGRYKKIYLSLYPHTSVQSGHLVNYEAVLSKLRELVKTRDVGCSRGDWVYFIKKAGGLRARRIPCLGLEWPPI